MPTTALNLTVGRSNLTARLYRIKLKMYYKLYLVTESEQLGLGGQMQAFMQMGRFFI